MKKNFKKALSLLLSLLMLVSLTAPAMAAGVPQDWWVNTPCIYIPGDSGKLYYDNDTKSFSIDDLFSSSESEEGEEKDNSNIYEAVANICLPFILEGIAFDKWDNYYAAVEKEIGDLFEPIKLDGNGNVPEGSDCGIGAEAKASNEYTMNNDLGGPDHGYSERTCWFNYDWRLDPIEIADQLNEFIEAVCEANHSEQVLISCKCLGTNAVLAYINKYGTSRIKGLGIDVATSKGSEFISGALSGDFTIDGSGVARILKDIDHYYGITIDPIIVSVIELLSNTGVIDTLTAVAREELYAKIEYGIISALATATFLSFPSYWALVSVEDFDDALFYVFGEKDSEKYQKYAGLIEKITYYNETIKKNIDDILLSTKIPDENGKTVNLCLVSKYGTQLVPIVKNADVLGDTFVSVNHSSFGATTSTVYDTLSDEYIENRISEGKGKYISPDKQIDASTCLFPDYTWFIKGVRHASYTPEETKLLMTVLNGDRQYTVDDFDWTQFIVYNETEEDGIAEWGTFEAMTEENCHKEQWEANEELEKPKTEKERIFSLIVSIFKLLTLIFQRLVEKTAA